MCFNFFLLLFIFTLVRIVYISNAAITSSNKHTADSHLLKLCLQKERGRGVVSYDVTASSFGKWPVERCFALMMPAVVK